MMMMLICSVGHKAVGDLSGVSKTYSRQSHSPIIEASNNLYVNTYAVDVYTSRTPEEGAHSLSWPNGLIIIIIIIISWKDIKKQRPPICGGLGERPGIGGTRIEKGIPLYNSISKLILN
jgi:hypothetical protein